MRNEGPFIVEWVSWYRMLGFDHILVATNDCTDHSPQLLGTFRDAGWLDHLPHTPRDGIPPKMSAHRGMRRHPLVAQTEWLFICDVDEFLVLHQGDGTIGSFMDLPRQRFLGMAFQWKCFGTSDIPTWADGLVHRTFMLSAPEKASANAPFKSIFRRPLSFRKFAEHAPRDFDGEFGTGEYVWVNSAGERMYHFNRVNPRQMQTAAQAVTHRAAQLNHYVMRSEESFELKRGTRSASAFRDRYTDKFVDRFNRNDQVDTSALRYHEAFDRIHAQAMVLPGVRRLHHLCCADYVVRLAGKSGQRAADDPRYGYHMDLAASAG
ncbi:MAG: glycosyltransferase family 2 protein [Rhodobacter sp.]|nr:glycosyltransferase family 2 protein [Rhodobacter sp.]